MQDADQNGNNFSMVNVSAEKLGKDLIEFYNNSEIRNSCKDVSQRNADEMSSTFEVTASLI